MQQCCSLISTTLLLCGSQPITLSPLAKATRSYMQWSDSMHGTQVTAHVRHVGHGKCGRQPHRPAAPACTQVKLGTIDTKIGLHITAMTDTACGQRHHRQLPHLSCTRSQETLAVCRSPPVSGRQRHQLIRHVLLAPRLRRHHARRAHRIAAVHGVPTSPCQGAQAMLQQTPVCGLFQHMCRLLPLFLGSALNS